MQLYSGNKKKLIYTYFGELGVQHPNLHCIISVGCVNLSPLLVVTAWVFHLPRTCFRIIGDQPPIYKPDAVSKHFEEIFTPKIGEHL